eukprot:CAMPEP_0195611004 /NCGR_PEP_ID=MMETSP0815-20121206/10109_1 /TAXON_ID=97485 /ORGANISM="Prymnesium parvum, Strain Texoma1" /LENGTH=100 /DNA_ID=CAMNT_0040751027 /DNA_START=267 /DNA_END=570 /DNA_ORIENTATION=+
MASSQLSHRVLAQGLVHAAKRLPKPSTGRTDWAVVQAVVQKSRGMPLAPQPQQQLMKPLPSHHPKARRLSAGANSTPRALEAARRGREVCQLVWLALGLL